MQDILDTHKIKDEMSLVLVDIDIEYIAIVNRQFKSIERIELGNSIILVAGTLGNTRLIDNLWV
jgi:pantoate--beta-alanine ligase